MKKIIREVDVKRGIVQVTVADERWYLRQVDDPATKLPTFKAVPSVTWICGHYPKGIPFYKWLADKGWDESQAIKQAAGERGTKVHAALSAILAGQEVRIDSKFVNPTTDREEELSLDEIEAIKSFVDWKASLESFEPIAWDLTVYSDEHNYAGSIDLIARVNGRLYVIDFKTSQQVWTEYELQVSAYRAALQSGENPIYLDNKVVDVSAMKTAILQVGYRRNKVAYKWTETPDRFDMFLTAQKIWALETEGQQPKKRDYPIVISPGTPVEEFELVPEVDEIEMEVETPEPVAVEPAKKKRLKA